MEGRLILVGGVPGSGKTYIGQEICKRLTSSIFIDKDTVSRYFSEQMLIILESHKDDRESDIYLNKVRPIEYDTLLKHAFENLELGRDVICTAPFIKEFNDNDWLKSIADETHQINESFPVKIWIQADENTARDRLIARGATRDKGKLAAWYNYIEKVNHSPPANLDNLTIIDNGPKPKVSIEDQIKKFIQKLKA